jgi:hypothetical protein
MRLKVYPENRCPVCGRTEASQRIRRGRFVRWFRPDAQLMKCRLCLTRYLVRTPPEA